MKGFTERRSAERLPYNEPLKFSVLFTESDVLKKITVEGRIINVSKFGIGIMTDYPIEAGHVLQWDDKHQQGNLHIATVKWSQDIGDCFRAGAMFV